MRDLCADLRDARRERDEALAALDACHAKIATLSDAATRRAIGEADRVLDAGRLLVERDEARAEVERLRAAAQGVLKEVECADLRLSGAASDILVSRARDDLDGVKWELWHALHKGHK